jgi:hypothetical protein
VLNVVEITTNDLQIDSIPMPRPRNDPNSTAADKAVNYEVTVTNKGASAADGAIVTMEFAGNTGQVSTCFDPENQCPTIDKPPDVTCEAFGENLTYRCTIPSLPAGGSVTLTFGAETYEPDLGTNALLVPVMVAPDGVCRPITDEFLCPGPTFRAIAAARVTNPPGQIDPLPADNQALNLILPGPPQTLASQFQEECSDDDNSLGKFAVFLELTCDAPEALRIVQTVSVAVAAAIVGPAAGVILSSGVYVSVGGLMYRGGVLIASFGGAL